MSLLCIYHGNCADGFGSAWAVRNALGARDVEYVPGTYGDPAPDVTGRDVIMVDFCYKRPVIDAMIGKVNSLLIIDHHKTARDDLAGLPEMSMMGGWPDERRLGVCFDMERSGALLTWDFFHQHEEAPILLQHISDRDLWQFKLKGTKEIQACIFSHPYTFEAWDTLVERAEDPQQWHYLFAEGAAIQRKHLKDINELIPVTKRWMTIAGHIVPVANLPYTLASDAAHIMAEGQPFAACYFDKPGQRVFSLRSTDEGLDVSAIALQFGGGGHKHAAGFQVSLSALGDLH